MDLVAVSLLGEAKFRIQTIAWRETGTLAMEQEAGAWVCNMIGFGERWRVVYKEQYEIMVATEFEVWRA